LTLFAAWVAAVGALLSGIGSIILYPAVESPKSSETIDW